MDQRKYRASVAYFASHFAIFFVYWYWPRLKELWDPPVPPGYGFDDPFIGPGLAATLVLAFVASLAPAIGALAGMGLAKSAATTPRWPRTMLFAAISLLPLATLAGIPPLLGACVRATDCTYGALLESAFIVVVGVWLVTPVLITKYLYETRAHPPDAPNTSLERTRER